MADRFLHFIVNPYAGADAGRYAILKIREIVKRGAGDMNILRKGEDATIVAEQALRRGATDIIAVGGDGTVSGVASALVDENVNLGIIPTGTANMFARELDIPILVIESLDLIMGEHDIRYVDLMDINGRKFIHQIILGASSEALSRVTPQEKRLLRRSVYVLMGLHMFHYFKPMKIHAMIDDVNVNGWASQILIANSGILGIRSLRLGPSIRVDDGIVNIIFMCGKSKAQFILAGLHLISGLHGMSNLLDFHTANRSIRIETEPTTIIRADGEFIDTTPLDLTVLPASVRIIVPRNIQ